MDTETKQITVLGKSFSTEEERREYFRDELRKKLPELKRIEGFPIGEDEDIIELSDPPFYTACPNPWLNDFIAVWEDEKKQLEENGYRSIDFEVDEPYASDVSVGKNNPVYKAHSYVTKVPHPAIMQYIIHYTQPGDLIYDGFSGTGMTGVASQCCAKPDAKTKYVIENESVNKTSWGRRKFIGNDLSVIGSYIGHQFNHVLIELDDFEKELKTISVELQNEFGWLFETKIEAGSRSATIDYVIWSEKFICSNCNEDFVYWDVAVNEEDSKVEENLKCPHCSSFNKKNKLDKCFVTKSINGEIRKVLDTVPVLIKYTIGGKSYLKKPEDTDFELIQKVEQTEIPYAYPKTRMPEGSEARRNDKYGLTHSSDYYTRRNLILLSNINKRLSSNGKVILTALIGRSTKLNCTVMSNYFKQIKGNTVGGWAGKPREGTLYLPSISTEVNIIKSINSRLSSIMRMKSYIQGFDNHSSVLSTSSSSSSQIKDNAIDYIFTDPPFGANRSYSELNFLTEDWLKVRTNSSLEAIENRSVGKSLPFYFDLMGECFKEYFRILKPDKWMTVEFSNTNASVWNGIQNSIQNAGFVISNVSGLDKKQGSIQALTTVTAVKQDLVISCYKPSSEFDQKFKQHQNTDVAVWDFVEEHLNHLPIHLVKDNATTPIIERSPKILFDRLIAFYVQKGLPVPIDAGAFQKGLRKRFIERDGMFFTNVQVQEYDQKKAENPELIQLSILISSEQDGVLWLKNLLSDKSLAYQDIQPLWMQALAGARKGDVIPELAAILDDNFLKDDQGKWFVPNPEKEADLEKLRTKRLFKQFEAYKTEASKPKGKIKEVRVEALRAGFKEAYQEKDFKTIVQIGDRIPNNLLMEDEVLLQFYDIAVSRV